MTETTFEQAFLDMQKKAFAINEGHGFEAIRDNPLYVPTRLALIMSEAAEALEAHRGGRTHEMDHELADVVLRCMNLAEALGIDLGKAIAEKTAINAGRAYKHGGKLY